jgi:hypothetical protein
MSGDPPKTAVKFDQMINRIGHCIRAFLLEEIPKNILEFEAQLVKGITKYHSFYFMSSGCI